MGLEWSEVFEPVWKVISSDGAPAWVQAVGSMVALFVAFRVSRISIDHAGRLKQKTIFSIAKAAYEYACQIRAATNLVGDEAGSNVNLYGVYHKDITAGLVRALQGVPLHELPSSEQVLAILGITNQLVFLSSATERLMVDPSLLPEFSESFRTAGTDRNLRCDIRRTIIGVLKRNAVGHLDKIDEHYDVLRRSLPH
ncbi:hypothetical protein [Pseudomonas entomophila]|uniref:hypothetical protein n=1 Tax=Pseudomonas entomophila TaxID=312306 RepID=UPI001F01991B|nr:hypothetical protein [Pseudomonas entomophila]MCG8292233.1 hypothetical protein [Pseudomonas entomophila]